MSIFWMRKRRLIISILIGILFGALASFAMLYFFRADLYSQIYAKQETTTYEVVVLKNALRKGEIIQAENIMKVSSTKEIVNSLSEEELIGKELSIDMHENIPLTKAVISKFHSYNDNDRLYEFTFIKLPNKLESGDFVDVRIRFKTGEDYLIAGKKEVFSLTRADGENSSFIELSLNEEELLSISSSYVDSILNPLCEVYLDKYVDPERQVSNEVNYPIKTEVAKLFEDNPNIMKSSNIEEKIKNRINLDTNMKKIIYENNKLVDYMLKNNNKEEPADNQEKNDSESENKESSDETTSNQDNIDEKTDVSGISETEIKDKDNQKDNLEDESN